MPAESNPPRMSICDPTTPTKLKAYYTYTEEEKHFLVGSKEVVKATGPLPIFMTSWVAAQRLIVATEEVTERRKRDTNCAKALRSIRGTLHMGTPHAVAPTSETTITIPDIWWCSLFYKIYFLILVQLIDFPRAEKMLGDEDSTFELLTPGLWRQASSNLLVACNICCTPMTEWDSEYQTNYNTEYKQHTHFFARLKFIEDLKMFPVWYPVENKLQNEIYNSGGFSLATWENCWMIVLAVWKQANMPTPFSPSCSASPFNSSSSGPPNRNDKRTSLDDGNPATASIP
ncbi:hypothetical protein DFH08DRAFT_810365 [Mycena albidolilacea]|uniref:Uncharacterized protein n=1 Tax=Mycena albidolilacea TaxID=1033008 RepID=A0AAD6ZXX7_9AGAR|nr:hypothetical protein DFH08DRAFT_810365 [Mycena albidolilacea]